MLTESFIDCCYVIALNEEIKIKRNKALYRDILDIIDSYQENIDEIPITFKTKFEFLLNLCKMKLSEDKSTLDIIDSLLFADKFKSLEDYIQLKISERVDQITFDSHIRQLRLRKKLNGMMTKYSKVENFLEILRDGTYNSLDDVIQNYEKIVKEMYTNLMEHNRVVQIESTSSLDLSKDSYQNLYENILNKYVEEKVTPSGIDIFDNEIFDSHGLEATRLYIFGGGSGSGKSTIMNNIIINSATKKIRSFDTEKEQPNVYVYITLENQIDEGFLRTYQPLFNKTTRQTVAELKNGIDLRQKMVTVLDKYNAKIVMKYFRAMSISPIDVSMVLDDVESEYGKGSISLVVVDYLDLLKSDLKFNEYRLELGYIALSLKSLAVQYNVPMITATQLNREIYRVQNSDGLNLAQMGESAKKIDHADFIALLVKDSVNDHIVHCKIGKNRSGRGNVEIDFQVDFSRYKFISGQVARVQEVTGTFGGTNLLEGQTFSESNTQQSKNYNTDYGDLFS